MGKIDKYKRLIENIPAVTWITDQLGNTVYISPSVTNVYGYTPDEIHNAGSEVWIDQIHKSDRTRVLKAYGELFSTGAPFDIIYRVKHKQGHWIWLHDRALATFKEDGFEYAYGVFFDVSREQETERALLEQEQRFETLVSHSTDWIWEFDENDIFTYSSPRIKELLGYEPHEIIGKSAFDLIPPKEAERVRAEFQPVKEARESFSTLLNTNQHKDGHLVNIESSGVPIFDNDGKFRGYRGIDRDISERKNFEAQLRHMQKMEAMGTLAGGIAHDFNNILAAILGYGEMLKREIPPESTKAQRHLEEVLKGGQRAKDLVTQILSFSREIEQERRPMQLHLLVTEVVHFLRATIPSSIEIVKQIDTDEDVILADPTQVHQVVMNLSTNAAHAMEERGGCLTIMVSTVELELSESSQLAAGSYVKLSIADTGGGIALENVSRIFDPYFTTKPVGVGTGLGLSVVHGIVQSHDGEIRLFNRPGEGTTFEVFFPQVKSSLLPEAGEDMSLSGGRGEILFVDDEKSIVALGAELLTDLGYQVTTETDSLAALELFKVDPLRFDLVITDQTMPHLSGDQLVTQLLQIRPQLPIVLCSGYSNLIDADKARALGVRKFLNKPVPLAELSETVRRLLQPSAD